MFWVCGFCYWWVVEIGVLGSRCWWWVIFGLRSGWGGFIGPWWWWWWWGVGLRLILWQGIVGCCRWMWMIVTKGGVLNCYYLCCVGGFYGVQAWHFGHQILTYFEALDGEEARKLLETTHCFKVNMDWVMLEVFNKEMVIQMDLRLLHVVNYLSWIYKWAVVGCGCHNGSCG